jgi:hypothetical protein
MMMRTARCRHSTARTSWAAMLWLTKRVHHVRVAAAVAGEEAAVVAEAAEGVEATAAAVVAVEEAVVVAAEAVAVVAEEAGAAAGISL